MHQLFQKIAVKSELNKEEVIKLLLIDNSGTEDYQLLENSGYTV